MAKSTATFKKVLFEIEEETTKCFVLIEAGGDSPLGVQGWHSKTFGPSKSCLDIFKGFIEDEDGDPTLWPLEAPEL